MKIKSFFESGKAGEFSLTDLSLLLRNPPSEVDYAGIAQDFDEDGRIEKWLESTAYFHELRHFHDLMGSPSGLAVFLEFTRLIDNVVTDLYARQTEVAIPACRQEPDSSMVRAYTRHHSALEAMLGERNRPTTEDEAAAETVHIAQYDFSDLGIDFAVPMATVARYDLMTGEMREDQVPLGLRALMEHVATELQFFFTAIGAGEDRHSSDDIRGRGSRAFEMRSQLVRRDQSPYFVVFLTGQSLLMRLRNEPPGASNMPGLGSLLALVQASLDLGGFVRAKGAGWVFEHPGLAFLHLLKQWDGGANTFQGDVAGLEPAFKAYVGLNWAAYISAYVERMEADHDSVVPPHLRPGAARLPLVADIRRIALETHLALMRNRSHNLVDWIDPVRYVKTIADRPFPPLQLAPGFVRVSSPDNGAFFLIWSLWLGLLDGIMNTGRLNCVIAEQRSPAMEAFEFPDPVEPKLKTSCRRFVDRGACGSYHGAFMPEQPSRCPFASLVRNLTEGQGIKLKFEESRNA